MEALACITKEGRMKCLGLKKRREGIWVQTNNAHGYITESLSLHMSNITRVCQRWKCVLDPTCALLSPQEAPSCFLLQMGMERQWWEYIESLDWEKALRGETKGRKNMSNKIIINFPWEKKKTAAGTQIRSHRKHSGKQNVQLEVKIMVPSKSRGGHNRQN